MATFELNFTGLCAFSPILMDKTMKVILVNAREHDHGGGGKHVPHEAVVLAARANIITPEDDPQARKHNFDFDGTNGKFGPKAMVGFLLDGEELTLKTLDKEPLKPNPGPADEAECPTFGTDDKGFGWVASMEKVDSAKVKKEALDGKDPHLLLARLTLDRGELQAVDFVRYLGQVVKWKIHEKGSDSSQCRALAEVAKLVGSFSSATLTIKSVGFDGSTKEPIMLKCQDHKLNIWLVNMPHEDIVEPDTDPNVYPDEHFLHFYRLSDKNGKKFPHPKVTCDGTVIKKIKTSGAAPTNPKCPPALFSALAPEPDQRVAEPSKRGR